MHMSIVWGKVLSGQWDRFEAAFKEAMTARGKVDGLRSQWLVQDQNDRDAGYSVSLWDTNDAMRAYLESPRRQEVVAPLQPFFVNQYTMTNCEVRLELPGG